MKKNYTYYVTYQSNIGNRKSTFGNNMITLEKKITKKNLQESLEILKNNFLEEIAAYTSEDKSKINLIIMGFTLIK